jgi:hypothetical protein
MAWMPDLSLSFSCGRNRKDEEPDRDHARSDQEDQVDGRREALAEGRHEQREFRDPGGVGQEPVQPALYELLRMGGRLGGSPRPRR